MNANTVNDDIRAASKRSSYQVAKTIGRLTDSVYDIMREQNLNNAKLAERMGRSRAWVGKLLSGDHNMTVRTAVTVFFELGHNLDFCVEPNEDYQLANVPDDASVATEYDRMLSNDEYVKAA